MSSLAAMPEENVLSNLNVHLLHEPTPSDLAFVRGLLQARVRVTTGPDVPAGCQILVAGRPSRHQVEASSELRVLLIPWAGLPDTTRELMLDFPHIAVHNIHHNAVPVAEMALGLLLAATKCIVPTDRALRRGDWTPRYQEKRPVLLTGKTALVLGYGAIGREVAQRCRGLGLRVQAVRRSTGTRSTPDAVFAVDALHSLLPEAHVLIACLPLTPQTNGIIGEVELSLLPADAVLVNVGRGPLVDEAALYAALAEGRLAAAGLDVWYNYPSDESSRTDTAPATLPFRDLDNVVMSPHRAGHTDETERLRMEHLAASLNAAARGEEIPHRVDLRAGY